MGTGTSTLFVLLFCGMSAQVKGGAMDSKCLLKGEAFFVCRVNCGPMKAQVLRANIHSHGGTVCSVLDHNASIVLFDKSCEDNPDKVLPASSQATSSVLPQTVVRIRYVELCLFSSSV